MKTVYYTCLGTFVFLSGVSAQIKTDASLGQSAQTLAGPNFAIPQTLGKLAGTNLFHSFETFNILSGQSANFTTDTVGINNVISRVTGGSLSQINGKLQLTPISGTPGFFFINPAGVTFGAGASIDVPGAFHVSTANYLKFADGNFYADTSKASTFSSASPEAFGFLGTTRAGITVKDGGALKTKLLQPISMVAGDIAIDNGTVKAQSGDIRVAAVGQKSQEIGLTGNLPTVDGNLSLVKGGEIATSTSSDSNSGTVLVSAGNITIDHTYGIYTYTSGTGNSGNIDISAANTLSLSNGGQISTTAYSSGNAGSIKVNAGTVAIEYAGSKIYSEAASGTGKSGSVEVTTSGALSVLNGGSIYTSTSTSGDAGTVKVNAGTVAIEYAGSKIYSEAASSTGKSGSVEVTTSGALSVLNGGSIYTSTSTSGDAGTVKVNAGTISIDDQGYYSTGIYSETDYDIGKAGNVEITATGALSVLNGGVIHSTTMSSGDAGTVKVHANTIEIDDNGYFGTGIYSNAQPPGTGQAGNVEVIANGSLSVLNGGTISSATYSSGHAGAVQVTTDGVLSLLNGGQIFSTSYSSGDAQSVNVHADSIVIEGQGGYLKDNAGIFADARLGSTDKSGNMMVTAVDTLSVLKGGEISSSTKSQGSAGIMEINVGGALSVLNGGQISSSTFAAGDAGAIKVNAGTIEIDGKGTSDTGIINEAQLGSTGQAGNVEVTANGKLSVINGGQISSTTYSSGNAGAIKVDADTIEIDGKGVLSSGILDNTLGTGKAGNVEVTATGALSVLNGGQISSSSSLKGDAGAVSVNAGSIKIDGQGVYNGAGIYSKSQSGIGKAGNVDVVTGGLLSIVDGGNIGSGTSGSGNAGAIKVDAGTIEIDGKGVLSSGILDNTFGTGKAGNVAVTATGELSVINGGQISSTTSSSGNAGSVQVKADTILIDKQTSKYATGILDQVAIGATGNAGDVTVTTTNNLSVLNGGQIISKTSASGNAGLIKINAGTIEIDGKGVSSTGIFDNTVGIGKAGNIEVTATGTLAVLNGGQISSTTSLSGNGGSVQVKADTILIDKQTSKYATGILDQVAIGATGNAGDVTVTTTNNLSVLNGGQIATITKASGNAGAIKVDAGTIEIDGKGVLLTGILDDTRGAGKAGNVDVTATGALSVLNGGQISSTTYLEGDAGSINVHAGTITVDSQGLLGTGIFSLAFLGSGDAGHVNVVSNTLGVLNSGQISSRTYSSGNAGSLSVGAGDVVLDGQGDIGGIFAECMIGSSGNAGNVAVTVNGALSIVDGSKISASSKSSGDVGSVSVKADYIMINGQENKYFTGILAQTYFDGHGQSGSVDVTTDGVLSILNGGQIASNTYGLGDAGSINVQAGILTIDGYGYSKVTGITGGTGGTNSRGAGGNAGNVNVTVTGTLSVLRSGEISSSTYSAGDAGTVKVNAETILVDGQDSGYSTDIDSIAGPGSTGKAGNVDITASGALSMLSGGKIASSTDSSGDAGQIKIKASTMTIDGQESSLFTGVFSDAGLSTGHAGSIDINTSGALSVLRGGEISSGTYSSGDAGAVKINAGTITINGQGSDSFTGIFSDTKLSTGHAGTIEIKVSDELNVLNGGIISTSTYSSGDAGSITVNAETITIDAQVDTSGTGISSGSLNSASVGNAGNVDITANGVLQVLRGGFISAGTKSSGQAGSVTVHAKTLLIDGMDAQSNSSGIRASAWDGSSGQTGSVTVQAADRMTISNSGAISIQNDATVINPASIVPTLLTVTAPDITLKDAKITAESTGNVSASSIQIKASERLFIDPSSITTSANLGNGGSISIQGGKVMTLENSRITTSVAGLTGNGGDIFISADTFFMNTGFIQANTAAANATGGLVSIDVQMLVPSGSSLFVGGQTPYSFQSGIFGFNVIQAAAPTGVSGTIQMASPALDIAGSLNGLNTEVINTDGLGHSPCQITGGSSLAQSGRGGLPPSALGLLRTEPDVELTKSDRPTLGEVNQPLVKNSWSCS